MKLGWDQRVGRNRNIMEWRSSEDRAPGQYSMVVDVRGRRKNMTEINMSAGCRRKNMSAAAREYAAPPGRGLPLISRFLARGVARKVIQRLPPPLSANLMPDCSVGALVPSVVKAEARGAIFSGPAAATGAISSSETTNVAGEAAVAGAMEATGGVVRGGVGVSVSAEERCTVSSTNHHCN
ncbi:hypothetical protein Taro_015405 [Colocasia esculenta]|uniref:Uncharacterized protein n=1 Tax=Colocasia esculenta TaxID=4460 RepID=A0A843UT21_COLES|nr:hypothetical protein [Colocasia esculenta]